MEAITCKNAIVPMLSNCNKNGRDVWRKISFPWIINTLNKDLYQSSKTVRSRLVSKENYECTFYFNFPGKEEFASIQLEFSSKTTVPLEVKFSLSVRNYLDCAIESDTEIHTFPYGVFVSKTISEFIRKSDLLSCVSHNIIKIHAEFFVKLHSLEMEEHIIVSGENYAEMKLQKNMAELFDSSKYSDVVFEVGTTKLKAHKNILSARSPVFDAMFSHDSVEKNSGVIQITDFDSDSFKCFLSFVYSGKVEILDEKLAMDLFSAAEKYDMGDLKILCTNFITSNLNALNVAPVLLFADTFGAKDLKRNIMNYILENIEFYSDVDMELYKVMEKQNPKLLSELLVMTAQKRCQRKSAK